MAEAPKFQFVNETGAKEILDIIKANKAECKALEGKVDGIRQVPELSNKSNEFLNGEGEWAEIPEYAVVSTSANGLAPQLPTSGGATKYLNGNGQWAEIDHSDFITKDGLDDELENSEALTSFKTALEQKITGLFTFKGSVAYSALPTPSKDNVGYVYDVNTDFKTDNRFVDGLNKNYKAGTNVVIVEVASNDYKFDVLPGEIDLSNYATTESVSSLGSQLEELEEQVEQAVSDATQAKSDATQAKQDAAEAKTAASTASSNASSAATSAQQAAASASAAEASAGEAEGSASAAATSAAAAAKDAKDAKDAASEAKTTAESAASDASSAKTTAEGAKTESSQALQKANATAATLEELQATINSWKTIIESLDDTYVRHDQMVPIDKAKIEEYKNA